MTDFERSNPLVHGYTRFALAANHLQSAVLLLVRLSIGWKMYLSGYRHLTHFADTVETFRDTFNVPLPTVSVAVSGATELVGGLLLMIGLATRLISIPLAFNFLVAILTAGKDAVRQAIFGGQVLRPRVADAGHLPGLENVIDDTAFPFMFVALITLAFGPGRASVDYLLQRAVFKRRQLERAEVVRETLVTIPPAANRDLP